MAQIHDNKIGKVTFDIPLVLKEQVLALKDELNISFSSKKVLLWHWVIKNI